MFAVLFLLIEELPVDLLLIWLLDSGEGGGHIHFVPLEISHTVKRQQVNSGNTVEFFQISGELPGKLKTAFRQGVSEVVRQALKDAAKGKPVSVYGNTMKAARICGKILPDPLLASLMKRTNQIR